MKHMNLFVNDCESRTGRIIFAHIFCIFYPQLEGDRKGIFRHCIFLIPSAYNVFHVYNLDFLNDTLR